MEKVSFVLPLHVEHGKHGEGRDELHKYMRVRISRADNAMWCCMLALLDQDLAQCIIIKDAISGIGVLVKLGKKNEFKVTRERKEISIELAKMAVGALLVFFLKYFRDGAAEADHCDIETTSGDYMIFSAADFRPPLSPNAGKKILS